MLHVLQRRLQRVETRGAQSCSVGAGTPLRPCSVLAAPFCRSTATPVQRQRPCSLASAAVARCSGSPHSSPAATEQQSATSSAAAAAAESAAVLPAVAESAAVLPAVAAQGDWTVLNFYHLVDIADPEEMMQRHRAVITQRGLSSLCGRIYISSQGINCQGGGLREHTTEYVRWVEQQVWLCTLAALAHLLLGVV
jgi:UPF0176 acylphosphatase like domain